MLSFVKEHVSLWQTLQCSSLPIAIYGMGDGAEKILAVCKIYDIEVSEVFASDEYVRGHSFMGYKVLSLKELEEKHEDFIVLLAFAAYTDELIEQVRNLSTRHTLYAPDVPVTGGGLFTVDYVIEHKEEFSSVYNLLADDVSKEVYSDIINFKISGKIEYLFANTSSPEQDIKELLNLNKHEHYYDLGAYDGDTILQLIGLCGEYDSIVAFEPDTKNFKRLCGNIEKHKLLNVSCHNIGSYCNQGTLRFNNSGGRNSALGEGGKTLATLNSVDNIAKGNTISYIKMDVEGAEYETLQGAKGSISTYKPQLSVAAYHRNDDLFRLPLYIKALCPDYKIYIRHHQYIPAWETIIYASSR